MDLILLKDGKTVQFIDGITEVNVNDDFVQVINVSPELPLDGTESLWVAFEKDSAVAFTLPLLGNNEKYTSDIPYDIVRDGGQWAFQILRRRYQTPERVGVYRQTASNKYVFTVGEGVKTVDGELVTTTMLTTLYRKVGEDVETVVAAKSETETNKTQAAQSAAESANSAAKAQQAQDTAIAVASTVRETAEMVAQETVQSVYNEVRDIARDEIAKYDFIKVVSALPDEGMPNRIYLIPKPNGDIADLFEMWLWVNKGTEEEPSYSWEYEGLKTGEIELVDYVKFTDIANNEKAGVIKISNLDYGVMIHPNGFLMIREPHEWNIVNARNNGGSSPVTLSKADLTVKECLKNPRFEYSDEEKAAACETIGAVAKNTVSSNGVYGKSGGNEILYPISQWGYGGGEDAIARRTSKGGLRVFLDETNSNPEEMATPRGYVDNNFVAKTGIDVAYGGLYGYAYTPQNPKVYETSPIPAGGKIPYYNSVVGGGILKTSTPQEDLDCANKGWVEGLVAGLGGGKLYAHRYTVQYTDNMWYDGTECSATIFFYSSRSTKFSTLDELKAHMADQSYIPATGYGTGIVNPEIITIGNVQLPVYCLHKDNGEIKIELYMGDVMYGNTFGTITSINFGGCWEV